ncbi:MAG: hypothetical protein JOY78_20345 [Pseudonocardia sp.]|nr:hypothetical protein [Pseudonocardia sp.]
MTLPDYVWTAIGLRNVLERVYQQIWDELVTAGNDVEVKIAGETVATFTCTTEHIVVVIDGEEIARYPAPSRGGQE